MYPTSDPYPAALRVAELQQSVEPAGEEDDK